MNDMIDRQTRRAFLALVRHTIGTRLGEKTPLADDIQETLDGSSLYREKRGVFVTIHRKGSLRGCIGYIEAVAPLDEALPDMALSAAFRDPRFSPLQREELPEIDIEISLLSPLFPIREEDVRVGTHGLVVSRGLHRGLLLPQVPVEQGWDRKTFLAHTCMKAGLSPDALSHGASLEAFTATVFGEKDDLHTDTESGD